MLIEFGIRVLRRFPLQSQIFVFGVGVPTPPDLFPVASICKGKFPGVAVTRAPAPLTTPEMFTLTTYVCMYLCTNSSRRGNWQSP